MAHNDGNKMVVDAAHLVHELFVDDQAIFFF